MVKCEECDAEIKIPEDSSKVKSYLVQIVDQAMNW